VTPSAPIDDSDDGRDSASAGRCGDAHLVLPLIGGPIVLTADCSQLINRLTFWLHQRAVGVEAALSEG
jgi:hypothetical protein